MLKPELWKAVQDLLKKNPQSPVIEQLCNDAGVTLLRLPPYHCALNPIELLWGQVKRYVREHNGTHKIKDVKELTKHAMSLVSPENCFKMVRHSQQIEDYYSEVDGTNILDAMGMICFLQMKHVRLLNKTSHLGYEVKPVVIPALDLDDSSDSGSLDDIPDNSFNNNNNNNNLAGSPSSPSAWVNVNDIDGTSGPMPDVFSGAYWRSFAKDFKLYDLTESCGSETDTASEGPDDATVTDEAGPSKFKCDFCDKEFSRRCNLAQHSGNHRLCDKCGQTFNGLNAKQRLAKHSKICLAKQKTSGFQCQKCAKTYKFQSYLVRHVKTCGIIVSCAKCKRIFKTNQGLKLHKCPQF